MNCDIWNIISSLSTLAAVLVSLFLAYRKDKIKRKLHIVQQFSEHYEDGEIRLLVTIENIGNVPIILNNYGRKINNDNYIMKDIQKYLDGKFEFILIKPNEAKLITYTHKFGRKFKENDNEICKSVEYKLLSKAIFKAQDTLGNFYS